MSKAPKDTALWRYINLIYEAMSSGAEEARVNGRPARVWEGYLTKLTGELGVPVPYYSLCVRFMREMGVAECVQRGGGQTPSKWAIWAPPTEDALVRAKPKVQKGRPRDIDNLEQRFKDLQELIPKIDVEKALADMQKQIDKQGREIRTLKAKIK